MKFSIIFPKKHTKYMNETQLNSFRSFVSVYIHFFSPDANQKGFKIVIFRNKIIILYIYVQFQVQYQVVRKDREWVYRAVCSGDSVYPTYTLPPHIWLHIHRGRVEYTEGGRIIRKKLTCTSVCVTARGAAGRDTPPYRIFHPASLSYPLTTPMLAPNVQCII